jgi:hypothetical protein
MQKKIFNALLIIPLIILSCSSNNQTQEDGFEDVEEFILCSEILFTEDLNSCFTVNISSSLGNENYENCLDNSSNICLNIPAQELITFEIEYIDNCGFLQSYTEVRGPFTFDPNLEDVLINVNNSDNYSFYNITGTAVDCNNNLINNGVIIFNFSEKQVISELSNGEFELNDLNCSQEQAFTIQTIDFNTNLISEALTFSLTTNDIELSPISSCNPLFEFITYQISDHPVITYQNVDFYAEDNSFYKEISYNDTNNGNSFDLMWYEGFQFSLSDSNGDISDAAYGPNISLVEHSIGQVGEFMIVSFSGYTTYYDESVKSEPINGIICVIRDF